MLRKMVSLLPVESLVAISSKDSGGGKLRERKSLNFKIVDRVSGRICPCSRHPSSGTCFQRDTIR